MYRSSVEKSTKRTYKTAERCTPTTAFNYLSAIRKFLQNGGVATDFMATSQYIRNTKAAMKIAYRTETGITVKDTVRLPVSMDMIQDHHATI